MSKELKIPSTWVQVPFSDLFLDPKNNIVGGPFGSNLKSSEYKTEGIPVFRIQNIGRNKFIDKNINFVTEEKAEFLSKHSFKSGDIIITKLGDPLGKTCFVPKKYKTGIIVADLIRVRVDNQNINPKFLVYQLNSPFFIKQFDRFTKGTTRPRIKLSVVRELMFNLPPLNEQNSIVNVIEELFSDLDNGVQNLKVAQNQLNVYRQALLKYAFEGKLTKKWRESNSVTPAKKLLTQINEERTKYREKELEEWKVELKTWEEAKIKGAKPSKPRGIKALAEFTQTELEEYPKLNNKWKWVKIDKLVDHNQFSIKAGPFGSSLKKEFYVENGYKIYGQEQVISGNAYYGDYYIDKKKYNELISCSIKADDILISLVGTVGKVLVLPKDCEKGVINPRLVKLLNIRKRAN